MTIEQLMDRAEALNLVCDGLNIQVTVKDFEDMPNAYKLCKQQSGDIFEKGLLGYDWCSFYLGKVEFIVCEKPEK